LRVFVGPVEIAGYYGRLASALRQIGVDAVAVDLGEHRFGYSQAQHGGVWIKAAVRTERGWNASRGRPPPLRLHWWVARVAARIGLLAWAITRFDAFVFGYGTTLLFTRELALLKLLRKRLVFVFNGSDARPPYIDGADMAVSRGTTIDECIRLARRKKVLIRRIERYADAVVSLPTFSHYFERPVIDYLRIGTPVMPAPDRAPTGETGDEIRILHSPSDPEVKGSDLVVAAVEAVRAAGLPVRLVELREVSHDTVVSEIARADFAVDQAFSDTPMAVFAAEAAAAGVPAVVGSYAWSDLSRLYGSDLPPVEECSPDGLADAITRLAMDREHRASLGARAKAFVTTAWAPEFVAERYVAILRGQSPHSWQFDPKDVSYLQGVGLSANRSREIVAAVLMRGGRAALQLADKPELEQAFVDFSGGR